LYLDIQLVGVFYRMMEYDSEEEGDFAAVDPFDPFENEDELDQPVTLSEGGQQLVKNMSTWFLPDKPVPEPTIPNLHDSIEMIKVDVTFENAEMNLKRELRKQYLAIAIACYGFLTVVQIVALITLKYWEYSPVVIAVSIMLISSIFYWKYIWSYLGIPFRRLWETPYPYTVTATILGCLAQHALFIIYNKYDAGQLIVIFFMIQAFYIILVSSTFRQYLFKWGKFIRHRKLCFEALQRRRVKFLHERRYESSGVR